MRTLSVLLLAVCLTYPASEANAAPVIEIDFKSDEASGQELIHARAELGSHGAETWKALGAITAYPALHPWICDTHLLRQSGERLQEFLIEFEFPWPVGRRWSRIEVQRESPVRISWRQLEGSLQVNQGQLSFNSRGGEVHIDYQATINVGLPDAWTRYYRQKFVSEFLGAVYDQVTTRPSAKGLTLANSSRSITH